MTFLNLSSSIDYEAQNLNASLVNISKEWLLYKKNFLLIWILEEDARGCPPSHARAREMASRDPSCKWWSRFYRQEILSDFIQHNSHIASIIDKKMKVSYIDNATLEQLQVFFDYLDYIRKHLNIRDKNTWNMNEIAYEG